MGIVSVVNPVIPGQKIQLLGAYCNNHGRSWNPDSGQPSVQDWFAGRQDFQTETGAPFLNGGNVFTGNANAALKGSVAYSMGNVNQVYTNPPYDYIPSIGCKLFQVGEKSPRTGVAYVKYDAKAYQDVADGLWDASWTGLVDAMMAAGRPIFFFRVAYEGNMSFMADFSGYDNQPDQQTPWIAAMRHVFMVIRDYSKTKGAYPLMGFNPSANAASDNPSAEALFLAIGVDVQNCLQFDVYNGYWNTPANLLPTDTSGKVAGVGPSQATLINTWNTQNNGFGWTQCSNLALKYGMPLAVMECGSSGGDHHMLDDPYFFPWEGSAFADHRAKGGTVLCCNIWSVPAGDGNTGVQFGNQPDTLASLKTVINTLVGDAFDPTALPYGGAAPLPGNPPPPMPHPTSISTVVVPAAAIKAQPYAFVATATGGAWSGAGNVQYVQTIPQNNNSSTGWVTPPAASVTLDSTGMIATISGLTSGITQPHTVQVRDSTAPTIVSPLVTYTVTVTAPPPPPPTTQPLTITYSDGSPSKTVQVAIGSTASFSVDQPPQPPMPPQTTTVSFSDVTASQIVTQNAPGTIATATLPVTVAYNDGTPSAVVQVTVPGIASVSINQPPQPPMPQQTTTVTFTDPSMAPIVTTNAPGTTVAFS